PCLMVSRYGTQLARNAVLAWFDEVDIERKPGMGNQEKGLEPLQPFLSARRPWPTISQITRIQVVTTRTARSRRGTFHNSIPRKPARIRIAKHAMSFSINPCPPELLLQAIARSAAGARP